MELPPDFPIDPHTMVQQTHKFLEAYQEWMDIPENMEFVSDLLKKNQAGVLSGTMLAQLASAGTMREVAAILVTAFGIGIYMMSENGIKIDDLNKIWGEE